jgi:NAD(P)-dependent dehydrogenase (short-subunit alcohol dehydrogenase family)
MIPLNRVGSLDELKSTALYLATCPAFLTGAELYIDGGHTII